VFSTAVAVISVERASAAADSDWELVLRALSYSLTLHLLASPWTRALVLRLENGEWDRHLSSLVTYGLVVLLAAPVAIGLGLNELLRRAERSGRLKWWHYALGGRDARQAWDFVFQRLDAGRWRPTRVKEPAVGAVHRAQSMQSALSGATWSRPGAIGPPQLSQRP
jgi:hypothetical protein